MPATQIDIDALAAEIAERIRALPNRSTAAVRAVRRKYSRRIASAPAEQVIALAHALKDQPGMHRFVGDELIANHRGAVALLDRDQLGRLGEGMAN